MRLGLHLSLGPNMVGGIRRAVEIGAKALQLFCGSPRSWEKSPFDPATLSSYQGELAAAGLEPLAIHATYLLNPAAPNPAIWDKTVEALAVELSRARDMKAQFYVIHPGSHMGEGLPAGFKRIKDCLHAAWEQVPDAPPVLFENTAGAGYTIGRTFSELGDLIRLIDRPGKVGVCLDTCHAYAAGYDITTPAGCAVLRKEIESKLGGFEHIRMLHINDSKFACGENKDRHEHIGVGFIGNDGFKTFFREFDFSRIGGILETPQNEEDDDRRDLRTLEALIGIAPPPGDKPFEPHAKPEVKVAPGKARPAFQRKGKPVAAVKMKPVLKGKAKATRKK
ncbi:MAG TPA: deoxyribonuclease IV [Planctomycetota bacterium]|jgi:deoxyribonuclease-4|nr:deoxyribonuclease IV [Planctomycetota bacterium]